MPDHTISTSIGFATSPAELVRIEAGALLQLATRLETGQKQVFEEVAQLLVDTAEQQRAVILCGIGKSGLIARKIAATLVSTGTRAHFLHPADALHGDLGLVQPGDVVIALSYSGETEELVRLMPQMVKLGASLVSFCGCNTSSLASASRFVLDVSVEREACNHQLAPTASTTVMLALGDALAIEVSERLNFQARDFADLHPGGQLGRRLATVEQVMHQGEALPVVSPDATMPDLIHEMSAKRLGITTVQRDERLLGILSDGDLRRLLERDGPSAFQKTAGDVMNPTPHLIAPGVFASDALVAMELHKITALVVTGDGTAGSSVLGIVHLHDLWEFAPSNASQRRTSL